MVQKQSMNNFDAKAIEIVKNYIMEHLDKSDSKPHFVVYILWMYRTSQVLRYRLASTLSDSTYYELKYNGDKKEWYLDAYKKVENWVMGEEGQVKCAAKVKTNRFKVGDLISVGGYAATCQEITSKGAIFLMNRYLDKRYPMNIKNTNRGGYEKSYLRKVLQSEEVLNIFKDIRDRMVPFENGDLLRIPFAGEMFGDDDLSRWIEPDVHMQWELMRNRGNRQASRCGSDEWGWLQNKIKMSSELFCIVNNGRASNWDASTPLGVRLVFMLSQKRTRYYMENDTCTSESPCKDSSKGVKE